jgi:hypothetical protein
MAEEARIEAEIAGKCGVEEDLPPHRGGNDRSKGKGQRKRSSGEGIQGSREVGIRAHSVSRSSRVIQNSRTIAERAQFFRASDFKLK